MTYIYIFYKPNCNNNAKPLIDSLNTKNNKLKHVTRENHLTTVLRKVERKRRATKQPEIKQQNGSSLYVITTLNVNEPNYPTKRHRKAEHTKNQDTIKFFPEEIHLNYKGTHTGKTK